MEVVLGLGIKKTGPRFVDKIYALDFFATIRGCAPTDRLGEFRGGTMSTTARLPVVSDTIVNYGDFDPDTWNALDAKPDFSKKSREITEAEVYEDFAEVLADLLRDFSAYAFTIVTRTPADIAHIAFGLESHGIVLPAPFRNGAGLMKATVTTDRLMAFLPVDVAEGLAPALTSNTDQFIACETYVAFCRGVGILAGMPSGGSPKEKILRDRSAVDDIVNKD